MLCICYLKHGKARPLFHSYLCEHTYPALKMHYFCTPNTIVQDVRIRPHKRRVTAQWQFSSEDPVRRLMEKVCAYWLTLLNWRSRAKKDCRSGISNTALNAECKLDQRYKCVFAQFIWKQQPLLKHFYLEVGTGDIKTKKTYPYSRLHILA